MSEADTYVSLLEDITKRIDEFLDEVRYYGLYIMTVHFCY